MTRAAALPCLLLLALTSCGSAGDVGNLFAGGGTAGSSLETQNACRERASEVYNVRDRGDIYAPASTVNTPSSSNYLAGDPTRGLSQQFEYGKIEAACEHDNTEGASGIGAAPPTPAPAR